MTRVSRRQFLAAAGAVGVAAVLDACLSEPGRVAVTRIDLRVPGIASGLDGVRIAHLTDVHLPYNRAAADAALTVISDERPEIVLLSGDMVETPLALAELAAFARAARGTDATFATLGNWEHQSGTLAGEARDAYSRAGVRLLENSNARVSFGTAAIDVVGIDDPVVGRPDLTAALRGRSGADAEVWMVHAPGYVDTVPCDLIKPPALVVAGHTHGGQVRLPLLPAVTPRGSGRFVAGWYRDTVSPLYVSRGIGASEIAATGVRGRFLCPPELPIFTLRG